MWRGSGVEAKAGGGDGKPIIKSALKWCGGCGTPVFSASSVSTHRQLGGGVHNKSPEHYCSEAQRAGSSISYVWHAARIICTRTRAAALHARVRTACAPPPPPKKPQQQGLSNKRQAIASERALEFLSAINGLQAVACRGCVCKRFHDFHPENECSQTTATQHNTTRQGSTNTSQPASKASCVATGTRTRNNQVTRQHCAPP